MRKYASDTLFINKVINRFKYFNRKLGNHRYSIVAFIAGGCIELCMVKLQANGANFCKYKIFTVREQLMKQGTYHLFFYSHAHTMTQIFTFCYKILSGTCFCIELYPIYSAPIFFPPLFAQYLNHYEHLGVQATSFDSLE